MGFWDDVNNNLNKNVNKPVNDWFGSLFKGGNSGGLKTQDLEEASRRPTTLPYTVKPDPNLLDAARKNVGFDIGAGNKRVASDPRLLSSNTPQPTYGNKMLSDEADRSRSGVMDVDHRQSLFDDLLGKITADWGGPDKSKIDYSPLDKALQAKMDALNGIRSKAQGNFDVSDTNLESMHRGFQNDIQTNGANRFNQIADTQKANLQADNQKSQDYLANIKAQDMAKRNAMLQNLGLTAQSAASPDESADPLNQAIASIASRNDANVTNAEADRGTNLAYNQGIAQSVGQQGVERRADLAQQLQAIFGKVDMASADAQAQNAQSRYELEQNAGNQQYQQWRDQKGFLGDTLHQLEQDEAEKQKLAQQGQKPQTINGFAGVGQDLINSGYDIPEIQKAMGALADINAGDYMQGVDPNAGYDKVHIYMKKLINDYGIDRNLAFQVATNYANLGNTSKYDASPY